jgi:hypothetical protein
VRRRGEQQTRPLAYPHVPSTHPVGLRAGRRVGGAGELWQLMLRGLAATREVALLPSPLICLLLTLPTRIRLCIAHIVPLQRHARGEFSEGAERHRDGVWCPPSPLPQVRGSPMVEDLADRSADMRAMILSAVARMQLVFCRPPSTR